MIGEIKEISRKEAIDFILPRHYAGRIPQITVAYGWFDNKGKMCAACTFGKPASNFLCKGLCGEEYSKNVYELNRLVRHEKLKKQLSYFVSYCLRDLKKRDWIIVSYSDTGMNHNGYIYQACNFLYTGRTKERTDVYTGMKHARHYDKVKKSKYRQIRTAKNRYVYFCTYKSSLKKKWEKALRYEILPYPKEENKNYILGEYQKPILVKV